MTSVEVVRLAASPIEHVYYFIYYSFIIVDLLVRTELRTSCCRPTY
jgi:hypothetical protein